MKNTCPAGGNLVGGGNIRGGVSTWRYQSGPFVARLFGGNGYLVADIVMTAWQRLGIVT